MAKKKLMSKAVGGVPMRDLIGAGIAKPVMEVAVSPFVGNANIVSGVVKLGLGLAVGHFLGKSYLPRCAAIGLAVDGTEDILFGTGITRIATGAVGAISMRPTEQRVR